MSYPCHYTNLCPHKPHKHAHTHTHTHTHTRTLTHSLSLTRTLTHSLSHTHTHTRAHTHTHTHTEGASEGVVFSVEVLGVSTACEDFMTLAATARVPEPAQLLLVLLVQVASSIPPGCPERCVCDDQHVIQCAEQDLRTFPTGLPLTTRQLILSNNRIPDLPALELNYLSDLAYLDCSNNSLTHISESTFGNLRNLAYLDLSFNSFCKIEEQTFSALESLVMLRLTDNPRLSDFHPQAFSHDSVLQVLDISRNNLSRLNVSSLSALGGLRSLGLGGNPWRCACDAEELCSWMHTDSFKFQGRLYLGSRGCCFTFKTTLLNNLTLDRYIA